MYTVTPTRSFNTFTTVVPGSRSIRDLQGHVTGFDFVTTAAPHTLKGRITNAQGRPLVGVTVWLDHFGLQRTMTDFDGRYSFTLFVGGDGYRVFLSFSSFSFDPMNAILPTMSGDVTVNYWATATGRRNMRQTSRPS